MTLSNQYSYIETLDYHYAHDRDLCEFTIDSMLNDIMNCIILNDDCECFAEIQRLGDLFSSCKIE